MGFANLQLMLDKSTEMAQERLIYSITAYMERQGMLPCRKESAERTIAFAPTAAGWAVYDDCADRLDMAALDGLGRTLTAKLHTRAIGVMTARSDHMLRLYSEGWLRDTYLTSRQEFARETGRGLVCRAHAIRWRAQLVKTARVRDLADVFARGHQQKETVFPELRRLLGLPEAACYGFASLEEVKPDGQITLYFCSSTTIRQPLWERLFKPRERVAPGMLFFSKTSPKRRRSGEK